MIISTDGCPWRDIINWTLDGAVNSCSGHIANASAAEICEDARTRGFCCQTCDRLRDLTISDCPYGDDSSCSDVISRAGLVACTWGNTFKSCCRTCAALNNPSLTACPADDVPLWTFDGVSNSCDGHIQNLTTFGVCGNPYLSKYCCETCVPTPTCEREDVATLTIDGQVRSCQDHIQELGAITVCGDPDLFRNCCEICTGRKGQHVPACTIKEDDEMYFDYCKKGVKELGALTLCRSKYFSEMCCESCDSFYNMNISACDYGDAAKLVVDGEYKSCQEHIAVHGVLRICNDPDLFTFCCKTCDDLRDVTKPDCWYGDINYRRTCAEYIMERGTHVCGYDGVEAECCK